MISKIYFWVYLAITALLLLDFPWKPVDRIFELSHVVVVVAAFGYIYRKPILSKKAWKILVPFCIIFWLLYILVLDKLYGGYKPENITDYVVGILMPLPIYIFGLKYSNAITLWNKKAKKKDANLSYSYWCNAIYPLVILITIILLSITKN